MFARLNTKLRTTVNLANIVQLEESSVTDERGAKWRLISKGWTQWYTDEEIAPLLEVLDAEEKQTKQMMDIMTRPVFREGTSRTPEQDEEAVFRMGNALFGGLRYGSEPGDD